MEQETDDYDNNDSLPPYRERTDVAPNELVESLGSRQLMDGPNLGMQTYNLSIVDRFITEPEEEVLRKLWHDERTLPETMFLSAQS